MLKFLMEDSLGSGRKARILDGTSTGSNDLGVDGSVTAVEFWIPADEDDDRYITNLSFILGYGSAAYLWEFADANVALTNGIKISYISTDGSEIEIYSLKANYDFFRFASILSGYIGTAWELRNLGATNDYGIIANINLGSIMPPFGVKLDRETKQKLLITIQDNCTDADTFICRALGFDRFE
jgi:hypothetical protein